jgi:TDG/mug DNA glycosylase family protein
VADEGTVAVYEANAAEYRRRRKAYDPARAEAFRGGVPTGTRRLDLGCGPGLYAGLLGRPLVATDVAVAMCVEARAAGDGEVPVACHDLERLPFRPGSFGGVWAWKCLQHVPATHLPRALGEVQRALVVGGRLDLAVFRTEGGGVFEQRSPSDDDFPGRLFTWWEPEPLTLLLEGAGFLVDDIAVTSNTIKVTATRARSLPDVVGPGMRLLVSGLNPSLYAADVGVAYGRPGNRFWPAALAAELVTADRRPWDALEDHGVGFTDLVKRATVGAAELTPDELRHGLRRLEHLCELLEPRAIAFCGITGWRTACGDRAATLGWQERAVGGVPAYVLPNPSGLNAHTSVADVAAHLRAAAAGPSSPPA